MCEQGALGELVYLKLRFYRMGTFPPYAEPYDAARLMIAFDRNEWDSVEMWLTFRKGNGTLPFPYQL